MRNPFAWADGQKPVSRTIGYDGYNRATAVNYTYATASGDDLHESPNLAEHTAGLGADKRGKPQPEVAFDTRVRSETYAYDGLGNRTNSADDQNGFYDRSLGVEAHDAARPYQLTSALIGVGSHQGSLTASYDAAGNQTGLSVLRDAASCMPIGANCNQRYAYEWDEYNRLTRARRWDGADLGTANDPLPETAAAADLVYAYNGADSRTRTTVVHPGVADDVHTLYIYASLELRRTGFDGENNDYLLDATHERVYLGANGERLAQLRPDEAGLPAYTGETRVFFEFADHLGSANTVVDKRTGELVEKRTYTAYGSIESDHRQDRWGQFREDYGFTTKEEDVEVGLTYFGKRFYNPRLGRWLNADPLAVHSPGEADLNLYAYVSGRVFSSVDPLGLNGSLVGVNKDGTPIATPESATNQWATDAVKAMNAQPAVAAPGSKLEQMFKADTSRSAFGPTTDAAHAELAGTARFQQTGKTGLEAGLEKPKHPAAPASARYGNGWGISAPPPPKLPAHEQAAVDGVNFARGVLAEEGILAVGTELLTPVVRAFVRGASEEVVGGACAGGCGTGVKCFVAGTPVATGSDGDTAIERIRVGDRVFTPSDGELTPKSEVDASWRHLKLVARQDNDTFEIELLRPADWRTTALIREENAVRVVLKEIGIDAYARLISDEPIADGGMTAGLGRVVTGTVSHINNTLRTLRLNGDGEVLHPTAVHPFYSSTRQGWVRAAELRPGEVLWTTRGPRMVETNAEFSGDYRVYNLEVEGVHTYLVGRARVLVHNGCGDLWTSTGKKTPAENAFGHWEKHGAEFPQFENAKQYVEGTHAFIANPPSGTLTKVRPNGDTLLFDPASDTFAVQSASGAPRTMFKPNPAFHPYPTNLDYFNAQ